MTRYPRRNVIVFPKECQEVTLPSEAALILPLTEMGVQMAGFSQLKEGYLIRRYTARTHIVLFTMEGAGVAQSEAEMVKLNPGTVFVSPADQEQFYRIGADHWLMFWFHLQDVARWSCFKAEPPQVVKAINPAKSLWLMRQMVSENLSNLPHSRRLVGVYAEALAIHLERELSLFDKAGDLHIRDRLSKLWDCVYNNPRHQWNLKELAEFAYYSTFHLSRLCQKCHKTSPMRMVAKLRMRKARELLMNTDMKVYMVAEQVGYGTPFSFTTAFRREYGISPGSIRKKVSD